MADVKGMNEVCRFIGHVSVYSIMYHKGMERPYDIGPRCEYSVRPGNALDPQKLLDARTAIESPPSALLGTAVR